MNEWVSSALAVSAHAIDRRERCRRRQKRCAHCRRRKGGTGPGFPTARRLPRYDRCSARCVGRNRAASTMTRAAHAGPAAVARDLIGVNERVTSGMRQVSRSFREVPVEGGICARDSCHTRIKTWVRALDFLRFSIKSAKRLVHQRLQLPALGLRQGTQLGEDLRGSTWVANFSLAADIVAPELGERTS